jgi:signal peptidase I
MRLEATMVKRWRRRALVLSFFLVALVGMGSYPSLAYQLTGYGYYVIPTNSMAPTIISGDNIRVEEGAGSGQPQRSEIWIFRAPVQGQPTMIKRVIGMPGDTLEVRSGKVLVNGQIIQEAYVAAAPTYTMVPVTLGPDEYFMLGDNRNISNDSHIWGPLKQARLIGRVRFRYWPPGRFTGL